VIWVLVREYSKHGCCILWKACWIVSTRSNDFIAVESSVEYVKSCVVCLFYLHTLSFHSFIFWHDQRNIDKATCKELKVCVWYMREENQLDSNLPLVCPTRFSQHFMVTNKYAKKGIFQSVIFLIDTLQAVDSMFDKV
jgi:hypothetical protein